MKKYAYTYRKRGLPNAPELTGNVEANNYHEAAALAPKQIGEEYVIIGVKKEDENESERVSEGNGQSDPQS